MITYRQCRAADAAAVCAVEAAAFPAAEAASLDRFVERLAVYPTHFWVAEDDGRAVGLIDGMVTNSPVIDDGMFADANRHEEDGAWQSVFGLAVVPEYQRRGIAAALMERLIGQARQEGRRGCILTCKERLIPYYSRFGYRLLGLSGSTHGGAVWYDMTLTF